MIASLCVTFNSSNAEARWGYGGWHGGYGYRGGYGWYGGYRYRPYYPRYYGGYYGGYYPYYYGGYYRPRVYWW